MNAQAELMQPYSAHELYLFECERTLRASEWYTHIRKRTRQYEVTRNGFTLLWDESLVRHFLHKHSYRNPDAWLEAFGRDEGSHTCFGWVKERKQ